MATRRFADLSSYRRALDVPNVNPLDAAIQGAQQGLQLQQLPQQLQDQALARQLQNALVAQKIQDLQNPQQALMRKLTEELTLKGALNPDLGIVQSQPGLVGETIANPGAITPEQQASLPSSDTLAMRQIAEQLGGVPQPTVNIPTASAGLPETPISAFGIQTGLNSNPNIPLQSKEQKLNAQIAAINARAAASGVPIRYERGLNDELIAVPTRMMGGEVPTAASVKNESGDNQLLAPKPSSIRSGGRGLTPNAQQALLLKYGKVKDLVGEIDDPKLLGPDGQLDFNKLAMEVGNAQRSQAISDLNAKEGKLTSKQKDEIGGFISAKKDLEQLKNKIITIEKTTGEPGFWQNAFAVSAATPSDGIFSSARRQLSSMALTDETKSKESARAGLEQAVKTALSGKTVSQGENLTLTALLPKSDDTLSELLGKLENLDTFLNNRIEGTREASSPPDITPAPFKINSIRLKK